MKNFIYSAAAVIVLLMAVSCQKEHVVPQENFETPMYAQAIGPGQTAAGPSSGTLNATTWESWEFCEKPVSVNKLLTDSQEEEILIYNQDMDLLFGGTAINWNALPPPVQDLLNKQFAGMNTSDLWQTRYPVNHQFIIEFEAGLVILADKGGQILCKGFHL